MFVCVCTDKPKYGGAYFKSHQNNTLILEIRMEFCKYFTKSNQSVYKYM